MAWNNPASFSPSHCEAEQGDRGVFAATEFFKNMLKNTQNSFHRSVTGGAVSYSRVSLQVGTSSVVYPAAMFAPQVAARGVPVAEFNMENTPATTHFKHVSFFALFLLVCGFPLQPFLSLHFCLRFHFQGPCGTTLPAALARHKSEPN